MDLSDYRCFEQLTQTLHFARAARALSMSPSALTRRIKAMEEELDQDLVLREHRGIRLTSAGERFRSFARSQIDQWEQLQNELREDAKSPVGQLHIACTVTACHTVLPRLLGTYRHRYPGVTMRLITQDATRSLNQLEAGDVDLAVIPTDGPVSEQLEALSLASTDLTWIKAAESTDFEAALSGTFVDWAQIPIVSPISGLERARMDEWWRKRKLEPHVVAEVRGNEGIIAMVSLGSGLGLVPRLVLDSSPLSHRVEALTDLEAPPGYQVSLCCRRRNLSRRVVELFWELAKEREEVTPR